MLEGEIETKHVPEFDTTRSFVRVINTRKDGFVEFEFAIGEPEYFVELLLLADDFAEFCTEQGVEVLSASVPKPESDNPMDWQLSDVKKRLETI